MKLRVFFVDLREITSEKKEGRRAERARFLNALQPIMEKTPINPTIY